MCIPQNVGAAGNDYSPILGFRVSNPERGLRDVDHLLTRGILPLFVQGGVKHAACRSEDALLIFLEIMLNHISIRVSGRTE